MIDPTAKVHPGAGIGSGVSIGAYAVIGDRVQIADNCVIGPHVVVKGPTRIGDATRISQFSSIGDDPQDKKYRGEAESFLEIGSNNVIREFCSINRGTAQGGGVTRVGNGNWIMAYVHIAHDCQVGNNAIFANNATLAGHVHIDDYAILGGFTGVHQFCRVGRYSISAIASIILKDVPPYLMVSGNSAKPAGLNRVGLKRNGFSDGSVEALRKAYRIVYREGLLLKNALKKLRTLADENEEVALFTRFIEQSERGIVR
ncbi:MAG: acyl-ACP--UDP-N-acetylglucosamine O-acyltransferase [Gammaproteobacteria bacterium]|nr:acyl-ACP--UDP-N-acetylglucosamine O-acyltransferase [Gammaproteobacteria bacterium]